MKLKALVLALSLSASVNVFAQWFPGQVSVQVLPGQVVAQVFNYTYSPIVCSGQVFGQTYGGPLLTSGFIQHFITPGAYRFAYVYTNPYAPFVNGWANFNCRYW